jgi:hypothetical protein
VPPASHRRADAGQGPAPVVSAGQAVTAKQPLVVVEAMKMENELRARGTAWRRGRGVRRPIRCAGALLVVMAP